MVTQKISWGVRSKKFLWEICGVDDYLTVRDPSIFIDFWGE